jgi:hypothetical protein
MTPRRERRTTTSSSQDPDCTERIRRQLFPGDIAEPLKLPDPWVTHVLLVHVEVNPTPRMLGRAQAATGSGQRAGPDGCCRGCIGRLTPQMSGSEASADALGCDGQRRYQPRAVSLQAGHHNA